LIRPSCALMVVAVQWSPPRWRPLRVQSCRFEVLARRTRPRRVRQGVLSYRRDRNKPPRPFPPFSNRNGTFPEVTGGRTRETLRYRRPVHRQ
jgi:hypothetical protein